MAAKMGVIGFVRGLANDVAKDGITVNAILPSFTNTPGSSVMPEETIRMTWEQQVIKRFAEPADIVGFGTGASGSYSSGASTKSTGFRASRCWRRLVINRRNNSRRVRWDDGRCDRFVEDYFR
jgi:NAD(P)-dependent dehydrogenase (short-subunit alcohol dehydrogenase family)